MADHPDTQRAITAAVSGRVQGVAFRYSTQRVGHRLGLAGWVRNEADGSVTVRAQGSREALAQFIGYLREGPPAARVSAVEVHEEPLDPTLAGFAVRY